MLLASGTLTTGDFSDAATAALQGNSDPAGPAGVTGLEIVTAAVSVGAIAAGFATING